MTTKLETPCREWRGPTSGPSGYGSRWGHGRRGGKRTIHRWVMEVIHGKDAIAGKVVMHRCDNPICFRYDHLKIGTQKENMEDARRKGRTPTAICGTRSQYNSGCRCDPCRKANADYRYALRNPGATREYRPYAAVRLPDPE